MNDNLRLYNFPGNMIYNIKSFIAKTLENRLWVKWLAEFLTEIQFYKKTDDATVAEIIKKPIALLINVSEYGNID